MRINIRSKSCIIFVTVTVFLSWNPFLFPQQDSNEEILVYFSSGVEREQGSQPARVDAPATKTLLNRFNIATNAVTSAFPDFNKRDTLIRTDENRIIGVPNMARIFRIRIPEGTS